MTDSSVVQAQAQAAANEQLAVANKWYLEVHDFEIVSDEDQELVAGFLRDVKARYKAIEEKRKEITVPLNQALKAVNDLFRPAKEKLEELERALKGQIAKYLEVKAAANVQALQAASVAKTSEQATEALSAVAPVAPPSGVSVRYVWRIEVIAPDLVPYEFLSPDLDKIKAYVEVHGGGEPVIPGVKFTKEPIVTARSK